MCKYFHYFFIFQINMLNLQAKISRRRNFNLKELEGEEFVGEELAGEELVGEELVGEELVGEKFAGEELQPERT